MQLLRFACLLLRLSEMCLTYPQGAAAVMVSRGRHPFSKTILMHDPVSFLTLGGLASVEHQRLLDAHLAVAVGHVDGFVCARGLPIATRSCSVGPRAIRVFSVSW